MKKFFLGLLSVFFILGASILTACDTSSPTLKLSHESIEIELIKDDPDSGYQIVTAEVSGVSNTSISAGASGGYENIIDVSTQPSSAGKTQIIIRGKTEGYAEFTVSTNHGSITKTGSVVVYSTVSEMTQKQETGKKNNYVIKGQENTLIENNLIEFSPSQKSRRQITWTLPDGTQEAEIEGNVLTISQYYDIAANPTITLIATTEKGVETTIVLPVIEKIEEELNVSWSYSQNSAFEKVDEENNDFIIVPNYPTDEQYEGYAVIDYEGELEVNYVALDEEGNITDDIVLSRQDSFEGKPLFKVYVNKDKPNLNGDYLVYFNVGYAEYNYAVSTLETSPLRLVVREKINNITVSSGTSLNVEGSDQILYTEYAGQKGREFNVYLSPTTVIGGSYKYSINVEFTQAVLDPVSEDCPLEFWYRDARNGNIWTQIPMEEVASGYRTLENFHPSVSTIYIKASSTLLVQSYSGLRVTFTSEDNTEVLTSFNAVLVRSVSESNFVFENAGFKVDSSQVSGDIVIKKQFTITGQNSVDGLSVRNFSRYATLSAPTFVSNDENSVTFEIVLTLKSTYFGITDLSNYQIIHDNGLESELFDIDIFLPLKNAAVLYDSGNGSNSVTNYTMSTDMYNIDAESFDSILGLSSLMLKNQTSTPVVYSYNTSNGNSAKANVEVSYYDYNSEEDTRSIEEFKALKESQAGVFEIINGSGEGSIIQFENGNTTIKTKEVGITYAVLKFTGKTVAGADEEGNITFYRIILIESYVSPDGLDIVPSRDSQVILYANDTVATRDEQDTNKTIKIEFANENVTYTSLENVEFESTVVDSLKNPIMGQPSTNGNNIIWSDGRYSISNIIINSEGISFEINALTTKGDYSFSDELHIHYILRDGIDKILDIYVKVSITIKNAQRIESLTWRNFDSDGIYFKVGQTDPFYMVMASSPTNAKNTNLAYLITDENGQEIDNFVSVADEISSSALAVNLSRNITEAMEGYIYVIPEDAINNGQIKYYYLENEQEREGSINFASLGLAYNAQQTWFEFLTENAYFKSNASLTEEAKNVSFADILVKTKITVADGKSFNSAFRIYTEEEFLDVYSITGYSSYYRIMRSLDLTNLDGLTIETPIRNFEGGIEGKTDDVTLKIEQSLFDQVSQDAVVRNLTLIGNIEGNGFVASENNGTIENITIDVDQTTSSSINSSANAVGAIVGTNNGTINGAKVLGTTIVGGGYVGGVAGINNGAISNSKVEFYKLEKQIEQDLESEAEEVEKYAVSTFNGSVVGGIAGKLTGNSTISHSYAYTYHDTEVLVGSTRGAFAGEAEQGARIDYSFAYLYDVLSSTNNENNVTAINWYLSYKIEGSFATNVETQNNLQNGNFVQESDEEFLSYVNGGRPYLKDLYQDEKVSSVDGSVQTTKENDYYKSLAVGDGKGMLFVYKVKNGANDLTSTEEVDLDKLNTISAKTLFGDKFNSKATVTSSNNKIVNVIGSDIKILKEGSVTLTISSKQDASIYKEFEIKVENAVSELQISWESNSVTYYVQNGSTTYLQETKSRDYLVDYSIKTVILGNLGQEFEIAENSRSLIIPEEETEVNLVDSQKISNKIFKITAKKDAEETILKFVYDGDDEFVNALNEEFTRSFTLIPTQGVIEFGLSEGNLSITPSTNGTVRVKIETTYNNDTVSPVISLGETQLAQRQASADDNVIIYSLNGKDIIKVQRYLVSKATVNGVHTIVYDVNFAVADGAKIAEDMSFNVYFKSLSGNESNDNQNGIFELLISRQNFTSVDVANLIIKNSQYQRSNDGYVTVHTTGTQVSTLAPGGYGSILRINVNPEFAYYDYMEISYSGADVVNAVTIEKVTPYLERTNEFVRNAEGIETNGNSLRFTPSQDSNTGKLYFRIWVNTTVSSDTTIKFTAKFFNSNESDPITYVNYYLSVSYLKEPKVEIDGDRIAYVALGSTADVVFTVLKDQKLDSVGISGTRISGIGLSNLSEGQVDEEKGIKVYTAKLNVSLLAEADNDLFYVQGQVSRVLNGNEEVKTTQATVYLVDFKVDEDNISISGATDNYFTIWRGVPKAVNVEYNLLPEKYIYDSSDGDSVEKVKDLLKAKNEFLNNGYYPANIGDARYYINYIYDANKDLQIQRLADRLFYVLNDNTEVSIKDTSRVTAVSAIIGDDGKVSFVGNLLGATVRLKLKTFISVGGQTKTIDTIFTLYVDAYSDPDIPLLISDAKDFEDLNPELYQTGTEIKQNDYILENDIVLEDYKPFSTDAIRSLDGNGHTIYIKNFDFGTESTLNIALFDQVKEGTTLKNVRVNLYNGGQLVIDKSTYRNIKIAGFAIENDGVIYNSEVVSYYTSERAIGVTENLYVDSCVYHTNPQGINVKFVNGQNTNEEVLITDNASWDVQIAGFVLDNKGSIANSRVGGDQITIIGDDVTQRSGDISVKTGFTYASTISLSTFNIIGQGDMAGFVLENSGYIASSSVKNVDMDNKSNSTAFFTAGFVGRNISSIITSYVEGKPTENPDSTDEFALFTNEGSSLKSTMGYISGFIYENEGNIKDSYSNILVSNSADNTKVYLASGFVYNNKGNIENCYSASQIKNSIFTQMNFSGVDAQGNLLSSGSYVNCYFFNKSYASTVESNDNSTETQYSTGAISISNPKIADNFYGFAVASADTDGTWKITDEGVSLVEPNIISVSYRYTLYVSDSEGFDKVGESDKGKYILPYATLNYIDEGRVVDTSLGGINNPIIVADEFDFIEVTGLSTSTYVKAYFNDAKVNGTYRLVNNINLGNLASSGNSVIIPSSTKAFTGILQGNGFKISGLSITSDATGIAYGLFASVEKNNNSSVTPIISNLNLELKQVGAGSITMVGGVAGYIKDSILVSVSVEFAENASVTGLNFVGGVTGVALGNNIIKNIYVSNPRVIADKRISNDEDYLTQNSLKTLRNLWGTLNYSTSTESSVIRELKKYSYAGGVIGFVDNFIDDKLEYNYAETHEYLLNNLRVEGEVYIRASVAGGMFGLTGVQSHIRDAGIKIKGQTALNTSKIIATKFFAGGVVGQSFSSLNRIFAVYDDETQEEIENNMSKFYLGNTSVERGAIDIFTTDDGSYQQQYIGGLVGLVESGKLEVSYSKLNVTSLTADYAGGVIGATNVISAREYTSDYGITRYLIREVYATGDVRANVFAGGIIGVIKGDNSHIVLSAVNAFNYISNYNYETKTYVPIAEGQTNLSANYRVNSLVGQFIENSGEVVTLDYLKKDSYSNFFRLPRDTIVSSQGGETDVATVAIYHSYTFGTASVTLNMFNTIDGNLGENFLYDEFIYAISSPINFTTAEVGHSETQAAFINSGIWKSDNWVHDMQSLFPTIRYSSPADVIYLDCFDIDKTINYVNQNRTNATVIVRGLKSAGDEEYADIDLTKIGEEEENGYSGAVFTNFHGTLIGNSQYSTNEGKQIKIIANKNFIQSVGAGFSARNLIVEYKEEETGKGINIDGGLFVESEIVEANIVNVEIIVDNPVNVLGVKGGNAGILAPRIINSTINKLSIKTPSSEKNTALLKCDKTNLTSEGDTLNLGLIAGVYTQDSLVSIKQIKDINFEIANSIAINGVEFTTYNVGTYFGKVERKNGSQEVRINISNLKNKNGEEQTIDEFSKITLTELKENSTVNVGGYIGFSDGLSYLATFEDKDISAKTMTFIDNSKLSNVSSGLLIGCLNPSYSLTINGNGSILRGGLYTKSDVTIENLNAGAIIGGNKDQETETEIKGTLNIKDFEVLNYEVAGYDGILTNYKSTKLDTNELDGDYDETYLTEVKNANMGAVIGYTNSILTVSGISNINNIYVDDTLKDDGTIEKKGLYLDSFRVKGTDNGEINIGSVVGLASKPSSLSISGVTSSMKVSAVSAGTNEKFNISGAVGKIEGTGATIKIGAQGSSLKYNGGVFINAKDITFGGAIGYFAAPQSASKNTVTVEHTEFAGALKIYGANSNSSSVYAGGAIGNINNNSIANEFNINDNNLYGDVFVEYEKPSEDNPSPLTSLENYYFGGIVANTNAGAKFKVEDNKSFMTSHNARYEDVKNTAHALFGAGVGTSGNTIERNKYNHSFVLLNDDLGTDDEKFSIDGTFGDSTTYGHKLKPLTEYTNEDSFEFNGMRYYKLNDITSIKGKELANIAIIGNRTETTFTNIDTNDTETTKASSIHALIHKLSGHSFVSSTLLNVDIKFEATESNDYYAGLVKEMTDNSIVFASQVKGTISIGGTSQINIAGLVGKMSSGRITDSSVDVNIIYRAAASVKNDAGEVTAIGNVFGLAGLDGKTTVNNVVKYDKFITNSYSAGCLTSYVNANLFAFANAKDKSVKVQNSYTFAKLDGNDYLNSADFDGVYYAFGTNASAIANSYYDLNGLNISAVNSTDEGTTNKKSEIIKVSDVNASNSNTPWTSNVNFNYGYPVLRNYEYLKVSSWATGVDTNNVTEESYDKYVHEFTYTRKANGTGSGEYYIIPNASVLKTIGADGSELGLNGKYVLWYDIDMSKTSYEDSGLGLGILSGIFDGNGHTISRLKKTLFAGVSGSDENSRAIVRNLRLTDAEIKDGPILATTLGENSTVSNITLSGSFAGNGALANSFTTSANINTVTNMAIYDNKIVSGNTNIGGLVGSGNGKISYCSNYGNIYVDASSADKNIGAGGLAGILNGGTIDHSYNAGAIIVGYRTDEVGEYYSGGLVGQSVNMEANSLEITDSYNSGIVKAGNKDNTSRAYAGGIVAEGTVSKIENCFNEGNIEALGKNPTTEFKWEEYEVGEGKTKYKKWDLVFVQTSNRNVWARAIGYVDVISGFSVYNTSDDLVVENGAYIAKEGSDDNELKRWTYEDIIKNLRPDIDNKMAYTQKKVKHWYYWNADAPVDVGFSGNFKVAYTNKINPEGKVDAQILTYDKIGLPERFILTIDRDANVTYSHSPGKIEDISFHMVSSTSVTKKYTNLKEYIELDADENLYSAERKLLLKGEEDNSLSQDVTIESIRKNTRSNENYNGEIEKVKISGAEYYLSSHNNLSAIFNAGIHDATIKYELTNVPYIEDRSLYSITNISEDDVYADDVYAFVSKVYKENNKGYVDIYCLTDREEGLPSQISFTLNVNYEKTLELNYRDCSYYYIDDYSVGINTEYSFENFKKDGRMSTGEGENVKNYDYYIEATLDKEAENPDLVYFAYDENSGSLVYIPNITIGNDEKKLNVSNITLNSENFKDNIETIINENLKGKSFYFRGNTENYIVIDLPTFTRNSASSYSGTIERPSIEDSINYSVESQPYRALNYNSDYNDADFETQNPVSFSLAFVPTKDTIAVSGDTAVFAYSKNDEEWKMNGQTSVAIGEKTLTYTLTDEGVDGFTLTFSLTNEDDKFDATVIAAIKTYIQNLNYISTNLSATRPVASLSKNSLSLADGDLKVSYDYKDQGWGTSSSILSFDQTNNRFFFNGQTTGLDVYKTYGDVKVYSGAYNFTRNYNGKIEIKYVETHGFTQHFLTLNIGGQNLYDSFYVERDGQEYSGSFAISNPEFNLNSNISVSAVANPVIAVDKENFSGEINVVVKGQDNKATEIYALYDPETYKEAEDVTSENFANYYILDTDSGGYIHPTTYDEDETYYYVTEDFSSKIVYQLLNTKSFSGNNVSDNYQAKVGLRFDGSTYTFGCSDEEKSTQPNSILTITSFKVPDLTTGELHNEYKYEITNGYFKQGSIYFSGKYILYDFGDGKLIPINYTNSENSTVDNSEKLQEYLSSGYKAENKNAIYNASNAVDPNNARVYISHKQINSDVTYYGYYLSELFANNSPTINFDYYANALFYQNDAGENKMYFGLNAGFTKLEDQYVTESKTPVFGESIDALYNYARDFDYPWSENSYTLPDYQTKEETIDEIESFVNKVYITSSNDAITRIKNNKITILLNINKLNITVKVKDEVKGETAENIAVPVDSEPMEPLSIILTGDISFNESEDLSKEGRVNIIGNGHYIKYYRTDEKNGFYINLYRGDAFIKDIIYLGETKGTAFAKNIEGNNLEICNTSFYGSINSFDNSDTTSMIFAGDGSIKATKLKTYVSVVGKTNAYSLNIFGNLSELSDVSNCGAIFAKDGADGVSGVIATSLNKEAEDGTTGENGGSIIAYLNFLSTSTNVITNNGIVVNGQGGYAGAASMRYQLKFINDKNFVGTSGQFGENGSVMGVDNSSGYIPEYESRKKTITYNVGLYGTIEFRNGGSNKHGSFRVLGFNTSFDPYIGEYYGYVQDSDWEIFWVSYIAFLFGQFHTHKEYFLKIDGIDSDKYETTFTAFFDDTLRVYEETQNLVDPNFMEVAS